jgi:hypothetical protein
MDCSLSPSNLVMILKMELIREIGLKSFTGEGVLTFGIRVMKELLIACNVISLLKKSKHS